MESILSTHELTMLVAGAPAFMVFCIVCWAKTRSRYDQYRIDR